MSETTERDARLRLYAELGDSRQYLGPHNDEIGARELMRADVASLLQERDALSADYAAAVRALDDEAGWRAAKCHNQETCGHLSCAVLSTDRALAVLKEVE